MSALLHILPDYDITISGFKICNNELIMSILSHVTLTLTGVYGLVRVSRPVPKDARRFSAPQGCI